MALLFEVGGWGVVRGEAKVNATGFGWRCAMLAIYNLGAEMSSRVNAQRADIVQYGCIVNTHYHSEVQYRS